MDGADLHSTGCGIGIRCPERKRIFKRCGEQFTALQNDTKRRTCSEPVFKLVKINFYITINLIQIFIIKDKNFQ